MNEIQQCKEILRAHYDGLLTANEASIRILSRLIKVVEGLESVAGQGTDSRETSTRIHEGSE